MIPRLSWLDWKLGARMLVKYPGLSIIGGLTLAVAIGIGAGWFEVTQQILKPRLPLDEGDRVVRIENWDAAASEVEARSLYDFQIWSEQLTTIRDAGAYRTFERNLITPDGGAFPATVAEISPSAFLLTRVPPLLGRTLDESDAEPGAADVVVLGYDVWQSRFNGDGSVVGRTARIGRTPATIVGVMPERFGFPVSHQLWTPLRIGNTAPRAGPEVRIFGRLADGATLESAQAELTTIGQRVAVTSVATHAQLRPRVFPYAAPPPGGAETVILRLSNIAAWLILAAACANVATLLFARTATREAEIVVRTALGASRARVMMQLFTEALVLCAVAALVGLTAASFAIEQAVRLFIDAEQSVRLPFWWEFGIRPATVLYTAALAIGGAALVALLPALRATGPRVQTALTTAGSGTSMRFGGVWSAMIVLQVATAALCLPLGVFAVIWTLNDQDSAFPTHEYLTFRPELDRDVALDPTGEVDDAGYRAHLVSVYEELERQLEAEPSVAAVTFANGLPGMSLPLRQVEAQRGSDPPFLVDANIEGDRVRIAAVDVGFFDAFRLPVLAGRAFQAGDVDAKNAVIINETLARNVGGNPLDVRIRFVGWGADPQAESWYDVVGVVRDVGMEAPAPDFVFQPASAADVAPLYIAIHARGGAAALAPRVRTLAAQVEPGLRLYDLLALDEVVRRRRLPEFQGMFAVVALTLLVMALSAAGLYSLVSVAVTRRTREIGIRLAIGASPRALLAALFARAAAQVGIGIVAALVLLPLLMTALGISELPIGFVLRAMLVAAGGMLLVGLVACAVPARRALRIQPTEAVKYGG
jgi:putative ABC transport system permease protein